MSDETGPPRGNIPIPDPSLLTSAALDREISHLRELLNTRLDARADLVDEKIASVRRALDSRDEAVEAALAAAKEAVGKAEVATNLQLSALQKNHEIEVRALRQQIEDVKKNATGSDVRASQAAGRGAGKEYAWGIAVVVAAVMISFLGLIFNR